MYSRPDSDYNNLETTNKIGDPIVDRIHSQRHLNEEDINDEMRYIRTLKDDENVLAKGFLKTAPKRTSVRPKNNLLQEIHEQMRTKSNKGSELIRSSRSNNMKSGSASENSKEDNKEKTPKLDNLSSKIYYSNKTFAPIKTL